MDSTFIETIIFFSIPTEFRDFWDILVDATEFREFG